MRPIRRIIIHHSLTKDGTTVSWNAIRKFHMTDPAYMMDDIGYHAGVELINDAFECLYGRPTTEIGAHTRNYNRDSLGFCFVGNYDDGAPEDMMLITAARLVLAPWCMQFSLSIEDIFPHSDFAEKTCPGKMFPMDMLKNFVRREMRAQSQCHA